MSWTTKFAKPNSKCLEFPHTSFTENSIQGLGQTVRNSIYMMGKPSLELSSNERSPLNLTRKTSWTHYHFLQQQQMKHEAEIMFRRNNSVINLNFDNSSCTPSMSSSTRYFISSLSINGSVANMDGNGSAFHLLGAEHSSYHNSQQHKRKCIPFDFTLVLCSSVIVSYTLLTIDD